MDQGVGYPPDKTAHLERRERTPRGSVAETRELSPKIQEIVEDTDQDAGHTPALSREDASDLQSTLAAGHLDEETRGKELEDRAKILQ